MIPKYRIPSIDEYMFGYAVSAFSADQATVNVHIPTLMFDKPATSGQTNVQVNPSLFVSKETFVLASTLSDLNYIQVPISNEFKRNHRDIEYAYQSSIRYKYDTFPAGTRVRIYCPNLNIDDAQIV